MEEKKKERALCPVSKKCGGCQLLDIPYKKQLDDKRKMLSGLLKDLCPVKGMLGMEDPYHYRNKVHAVFSRDRKGNPVSGVYQANSHIVVPVEKCLIEDEKADEIIGTIRGMLRSFKIKTYDEDTGYGLLRHVLVKRGFSTNEIMVVLVTASPIFPSKNNFVKALRQKHPEITVLYGQPFSVRNTYQRSPHIIFIKTAFQSELLSSALEPEYAGKIRRSLPGLISAVTVRPGRTASLPRNTEQHAADKGMKRGFSAFIGAVHNVDAIPEGDLAVFQFSKALNINLCQFHCFVSISACTP